MNNLKKLGGLKGSFIGLVCGIILSLILFYLAQGMYFSFADSITDFFFKLSLSAPGIGGDSIYVVAAVSMFLPAILIIITSIIIGGLVGKFYLYSERQ